jgi:hypothetical protein
MLQARLFTIQDYAVYIQQFIAVIYYYTKVFYSYYTAFSFCYYIIVWCCTVPQFFAVTMLQFCAIIVSQFRAVTLPYLGVCPLLGLLIFISKELSYSCNLYTYLQEN